MLADIGKFLKTNVVDPIDHGVIRPLDRAIVQPIREATDKDYALRHERKEMEKLEAKNAKLRPIFFQAQQELAVAKAGYERASEDFAKTYGEKELVRIVPKGGSARMPDPRDNLPEALRVASDAGRYVLKTVTLGLTEAIFNIEEIPRERAFLKQRIAKLMDEWKALSNAIRRLDNATAKYRTATREIRAEHLKLGAEATASDLHVVSARASAQKDIIVRLLADDLPQPKIAEITGIAPEMIAEVAQNATIQRDRP